MRTVRARTDRRTSGMSHTSISDTGYLQLSRQPLQSLIFLAPLVVLYEAGTLLFVSDPSHGVTRWIYARSLLQDFFELFGVSGYYLPGLIVVAVLVSWHLMRRDPWIFRPRLYFVMGAESLILAVPLYVFALILFREPVAQMVLQAGDSGAASGWRAQLVLSVGAGIYEELLFRLIGIALLHALLVDLLALPEHVGAIGAIVGSALAFAIYHFSDSNPFVWRMGLFYAGSGVYLAGVYVLRGFGVVAGTHALYDVMLVVL